MDSTQPEPEPNCFGGWNWEKTMKWTNQSKRREIQLANQRAELVALLLNG